ncbi:MAG: hypothetical protein GY719_31655, partial [bacterium]|nr:hypothetical protein [bacterium]
GFAVVHKDKPNQIVENTQIWDTLPGAAHQADAILRRGDTLDLFEQDLADSARVANRTMAVVRPNGTVETFNEALGREGISLSELFELEGGGDRAVAAAAARLKEIGYTVETDVEGKAALEKEKQRMLAAQATVDAHSTDPEHVGKTPAEVVHDVNETRRETDEEVAARVIAKREKKKEIKRKARAAARRQSGKARKKPEPKTAREVVARWGGLRWDADVAHLDDGKRRAGMHGAWLLKQGSKAKGLSWEEASQKLLDAGFDPDEGSIGAMAGQDPGTEEARGISKDRLMQLLAGNEVPADLAAQQANEAQAAEQQRIQDEAQAQAIAAGFESVDEAMAHARDNAPPDPVGLGGTSSDLMQGDVEPGIRIAQAGAAAEKALNIMRAAGLLEPEQGTDSWSFARNVHIAAADPDGNRLDLIESGAFATQVEAEAAADQLSEAARQVIAYQQIASMALAEQDGPEMRERLSLYWQAREHEAAQLSYPLALTAQLRKAGMMAPSESVIPPSIGRELQSWYEARSPQAGESLGPREIRAFYSFSPWDAVSAVGIADPYTRGNEFFLSRLFRSNALTQRLGKMQWTPLQKLLGLGNAAQRAAGRFASGVSLSVDAADRNRKFISLFARVEGERNTVNFRMQQILQDLHAPFGRSGADLETQRVLMDMIDSGTLKRMKSEADVRKAYGERYGYLFDVARRMTEVTDELGRTLVRQGWLKPEQFNRWQGRYVMHAYLKEDQRTIYELAAKGDYAGVLAGRNLSRSKDGTHDRAIRIISPQVFERAAMQETKAAQFFGILNGLVDDGITLPQAEVRKFANGYEKGQYETAALDGPAGQVLTDPIHNRSAKRRQTMLYQVLADLRADMQSPPNKPQKEGPHRPWTPEMQRLFDTYLGVKNEDGSWDSEPVAVTAGVAQRLEVVIEDTFGAQNPDSRVQMASQTFDRVMSRWRSNVTILNPTHWVLARVSDVFTNWESGVVGVGDFVSSMLLGRGRYYDAMTRINGMHEWTEMGMPTEKPAGWSDRRWSDLEHARASSELLFGSTFTQTMLQSGRLGDVFTSLSDPDALKDQLEQEIKLQTSGDMGLRDGLTLAAARYVKGMMPGKMAWEQRWMERWGARDAPRKVEALMDWINEYQTFEFMSKYAGILNLQEKNPGMSLEDAAFQAAHGTADYRDTSVNLQQWTTNFNIFDGQTGRDQLLNAGRAMFAQPFLMYNSSYIPQAMRNHVARPLQVAASGALMLGIQQLVTSGMDDDDREEWQRSRAGSQDAPGRPWLTPEEGKRIADMTLGFKMPWPGGGELLSQEQRRAFWPVVVEALQLGPGELRSPSRGAHSRFSDLSRMMGSTQYTVGTAAGVRDLDHMSTRDIARAALNKLEGTVFSVARGFMGGGADFIKANGSSSNERARVTAKTLLNFASTMSGALNPTPRAFFSRQHQHAFEGLVLGQQSLPDWFGGQIPGHLSSPRDALGEVAFSSVMPSRGNRPYRGIADESSIVQNMLGQMFPGFEASDPDTQTKGAATRLVTEQVSDVVVGEYFQYRRLENPPEEIAAALRRAGQPDDLWSRIGLRLNVNFDIVPGSNPPVLKPKDELVSDLGRRIAREADPEIRRMAIIGAQRFLAGAAWNGSAREVIMEQAAMRNVTPDELELMYRNSLKDDGGRALIKTFHRMHIREGNEESSAATFRVFSYLPEPKRDDGAWSHWKELYDYYRAGDLAVPNRPPSGIKGALPRQLFGRDIKPARSSRRGINQLQKDLR